jgi:hypothetical protein
VCYKKLRKKIEEHDLEIVKKTQTDETDAEFRTQMLNLADDVKNMKDEIRSDISELNNKIESVSSSVHEIRQTSEENDRALSKRLESYESKNDQIDLKIDAVRDNVIMMIESDKESNCSFITIEYYNAIYRGYIEVYVLQAVERRYERYLQENGDSFIANLMEELRKLPHEPPKPQKKKTTRSKKAQSETTDD